MEKTENKHVQKIKKMFDENNLDVAERKLDAGMAKISRISWLQKLMNHKRMKDILSSKMANDFNTKLAPSLKILVLVIGWISVVSGVIGIFSFVAGLLGLSYYFSFGFGVGIREILSVIIILLSCLLSLAGGLGMIRMKSWLPELLFLGFLLTIVSFLRSLVPSGFLVSSGGIGNSFLTLILYFLLVVLVFKNKSLFTK
ncbi:MAG: hypothetical protein NTX91_02450 [candidate division SR1 bacterium]|nr:hypothetical protein [candidate division SR1 bacterium]